MRPTLEDVIPYGTVEEMRAAYAGTPVEVRRLFTTVPEELESDAWLVFAMLAGEVYMYSVPEWVEDLNCAPLSIARIKCDPCKSPGFWRIQAENWERHHAW